MFCVLSQTHQENKVNTEPLLDSESIELMFLSQILVLMTSLMEQRLIQKLN